MLRRNPNSTNSLTVTSTADSGAGTLRDALQHANRGDSIIFSLPMPATIALTSGELAVSNSVSILGPGPENLAVNGNYPVRTNRVFHIMRFLTVVIAGLTIT